MSGEIMSCLKAISALADGLRARDTDLKEIQRDIQFIRGYTEAANENVAKLESMLTEQKQEIQNVDVSVTKVEQRLIDELAHRAMRNFYKNSKLYSKVGRGKSKRTKTSKKLRHGL